ncbi:peptidase [Marivirga lumbricoides]|uniref:Peptidase n=1 Tax=Marivirga lumbricoides TaxID=1046115 RepID=A0ABQ1L8I1_9BACT|nr:peptidase [Marivirga lumbricoides]
MISKSKFIRVVFSVVFLFLSSQLLVAGQKADSTIHQLVQQRTNQIFDSLVKIRRDFHMYPEVSGEEKMTSGKVAEYLKALGLEVHTNIGGYGVVGILETNRKGKKIAWRADMDAMPSDQQDPVAYHSEIEGVRHICGHDVHTTIGLGIANVLTSLKDQLSGTVYFLFQPSEENWKGARAMLDDGILEMIQPDEIYALHVAPMPEGTIATRGNNLYADYKIMEILFDNIIEKDALTAYVKSLLEDLQNVAPDSKFWDNRSLMDPTIGLGNPNTIFKDYITTTEYFRVEEKKGQLSIKANLCTSEKDQINSIVMEIKEKIKASEYAKSFAGINTLFEVDLVLNDEELADQTIKSISSIYGPQHAIPLYGVIPDGRSDDFAFFQQEVPGVYFLIGASDYQKGIISMPHSPNFVVDENCIRTGAQFFSSMIVERLK